MTHEQDGELAPPPVLAEGAARGSHDLLRSVPGADNLGGSESVTTVLVAFGANVLVAVAKSVAAVVTGSVFAAGRLSCASARSLPGLGLGLASRQV